MRGKKLFWGVVAGLGVVLLAGLAGTLYLQQRAGQRLQLVVYKAKWCAPCKDLEVGMQKRGITMHWPVRWNPLCQVRIPIEYVEHGKDENNRWYSSKTTDAYPEQGLYLDGRLVATENWSDERSMDLWLHRTLAPMRRKEWLCAW